MSRVSVIGLGKLGAPIATLFASKGHSVVGVDLNPDVLQALRARRSPVPEPGVEQLLVHCGDRLSPTDDYAVAMRDSDITFVLVATPSQPDGAFSLKYILPACREIGTRLRSKSTYHLVVITSTVLPGMTDGPIRAALEETSGKRAGDDFGLCYSPEFVALGTVLSDLRKPDFILIGESDPKAGQVLADFHRTIADNDPPIARMNFVNAELTKIALNTFVTTKITFANMLARMCEKLPGANSDVVTAALGLDARIGKKYLRGALAYGGPCFPRDNLALSAFARQIGVPATLAEATDSLNRRQADLLLDSLRPHLRGDGPVAILGVTYKANTPVVEESAGMAVARALLKDKRVVRIYDPAGMDNAKRELGTAAVFCATMRECVRGASAVLILTPWEEFRSLTSEDLTSSRPLLLDCWKILDPNRFLEAAEYRTVGTGS